jgi:glutathione S-transferase
MKLFYAPGTSAVGIRVLLEEIGNPYEVVTINLRGGEQYQPPFASTNPKSKVPTLVRDDNSC